MLLPKGANVVDKQVADIPWQTMRVELRAVRRAGEEVESPDASWQFNEGDILLLQGRPRRIEKLNLYCYKGRFVPRLKAS